MKKSKLVLWCTKDVVNAVEGEKCFIGGEIYIAYVEDTQLFAMDDCGEKHYIAGSRGGLWHNDEWFADHFTEDKKLTYRLLKYGRIFV